MKLFDLQRSPNCRKVRIAARELGVELDLVPMDFAAAKQPDYLARNPAGKVPTLVDDDGFSLWESGAILAYLADKHPSVGLLPTDPRVRADVLRWMFFVATHVQPWLSLLGQQRIIRLRQGQSPEPALVALAEHELQRFLPILDAHLEHREYLAEQYSIADIAAGSGFEDCEARGINLEPYVHLSVWRKRLRQRPAWSD